MIKSFRNISFHSIVIAMTCISKDKTSFLQIYELMIDRILYLAELHLFSSILPIKFVYNRTFLSEVLAGNYNFSQSLVTFHLEGFPQNLISSFTSTTNIANLGKITTKSNGVLTRSGVYRRTDEWTTRKHNASGILHGQRHTKIMKKDDISSNFVKK